MFTVSNPSSQHAAIEQGKVNLSEFKVNTTLLSDGVHDLQQMSLHLSWEKSNKSLMIALSTQGQSIDCTMPDRDPPCFITRGTVSSGEDLLL